MGSTLHPTPETLKRFLLTSSKMPIDQAKQKNQEKTLDISEPID